MRGAASGRALSYDRGKRCSATGRGEQEARYARPDALIREGQARTGRARASCAHVNDGRFGVTENPSGENALEPERSGAPSWKGHGYVGLREDLTGSAGVGSSHSAKLFRPGGRGTEWSLGGVTVAASVGSSIRGRATQARGSRQSARVKAGDEASQKC